MTTTSTGPAGGPPDSSKTSDPKKAGPQTSPSLEAGVESLNSIVKGLAYAVGWSTNSYHTIVDGFRRRGAERSVAADQERRENYRNTFNKDTETVSAVVIELGSSVNAEQAKVIAAQLHTGGQMIRAVFAQAAIIMQEKVQDAEATPAPDSPKLWRAEDRKKVAESRSKTVDAARFGADTTQSLSESYSSLRSFAQNLSATAAAVNASKMPGEIKELLGKTIANTVDGLNREIAGLTRDTVQKLKSPDGKRNDDFVWDSDYTTRLKERFGTAAAVLTNVRTAINTIELPMEAALKKVGAAPEAAEIIKQRLTDPLLKALHAVNEDHNVTLDE